MSPNSIRQNYCWLQMLIQINIAKAVISGKTKWDLLIQNNFKACCMCLDVLNSTLLNLPGFLRATVPWVAMFQQIMEDILTCLKRRGDGIMAKYAKETVLQSFKTNKRQFHIWVSSLPKHNLNYFTQSQSQIMNLTDFIRPRKMLQEGKVFKFWFPF